MATAGHHCWSVSLTVQFGLESLIAQRHPNLFHADTVINKTTTPNKDGEEKLGVNLPNKLGGKNPWENAAGRGRQDHGELDLTSTP